MRKSNLTTAEYIAGVWIVLVLCTLVALEFGETAGAPTPESEIYITGSHASFVSFPVQANAEITADPIPATVTEPSPETVPKVDEPILYYVPLADELQLFLFEQCEDHNVPFELALAIIWTESNYQTDLISETDDYGIFQINQCNHSRLRDELGINDFLDPEDNIMAGVYMLSGLLQKYDDQHMALMAYNIGEGGAQEQWSQGNYTSWYSQLVIGRMDELQERMVT